MLKIFTWTRPQKRLAIVVNHKPLNRKLSGAEHPHGHHHGSYINTSSALYKHWNNIGGWTSAYARPL